MVTEGQQAYNLRVQVVHDWFQLLYEGTKGHVSIVSTSNWAGRAFEVSQLDDMVKYVVELDNAGAKGIYARVTTLRERPIEGRGSEEDSLFLPGLWADMDLAGPGHKTTQRLPETFGQCMEIINEAKLPPPALWVHSGGGLYPWWLFEEPLEIQDEGDLRAYQELSRGWHDAIAGAAKRLGFHYGPVHDLARVLRIPGTTNRKIDGDPKPCEIIHWTGAGRYPEHEIVAAAGMAADHLKASMPAPAPRPTPTPVIGSGERPGDVLAASKSWQEILEPAGFTLSHGRPESEEYWVRPGKHPRDGHSVTTNYQGSDLMYVFSTEIENFEPNTTYSKFAAWSILNGHGMDFRAAALALGGDEWRDRAYERSQKAMEVFGGPDLSVPGPPPPPKDQAAKPPPHRDYTYDDIGNAQRIRDHFGAHYRYVKAYGDWMRWDGRVWVRDDESKIKYAAQVATEAMIEQANEMERNAVTDEDTEKVKSLRKHIKSSRSSQRLAGAVAQLIPLPGMSARPDSFDHNGRLITVHNGVFNLDTMELGQHDPAHMLTRVLNARYDAAAKCPKWEQFLEQVLPNPAVRAYVQRALGYTLFGEADRRAIFMLYGESGTGKSQFLEALAYVFGDFSTTAAAATFRKKRNEGGATNDLHDLKGKRFITSSETSETSELDEELIKRLTGRDQIRSRDLYEKNQSWVPEGAVWLATNYLPRLSGDDNAVWARMKPIEFNQVFMNTDRDEPNVGVKIAAEEAAGIFNWLLEGVRQYRQHGLAEPTEVKQSNEEHRRTVDDVIQFLEARQDAGLIVEEEGAKLRVSDLYKSYEDWCVEEKIKPLGQRNFNRRCRARGMQSEKTGPYYFWIGIKYNPAFGVAGTMTPPRSWSP